MALPEAFLHGVQRVAIGESFDGDHGAAVALHGEHGARLDGFAVHEHRARAAQAGLAADVSASQIAVIADEMNEKQAGFNGCS